MHLSVTTKIYLLGPHTLQIFLFFLIFEGLGAGKFPVKQKDPRSVAHLLLPTWEGKSRNTSNIKPGTTISIFSAHRQPVQAAEKRVKCVAQPQ